MNNRSTWISGRKVLGIVIILAVIVLSIYLFFLYQYIERSKFSEIDKTIAFVKKETEIDRVTESFFFSNDKSYEILYGKDELDQSFMLFNPAGNRDPDELITLSRDKLYTKQMIEDTWQEECATCILKKSSPAMINSEPLWELTYMNQQKNYVIEYISLKDGSVFEKLSLHQKYNKEG